MRACVRVYVRTSVHIFEEHTYTHSQNERASVARERGAKSSVPRERDIHAAGKEKRRER